MKELSVPFLGWYLSRANKGPEALARQLRMATAHLSPILKGHMTMRADLAADAATFLRCTVHQLANGPRAVPVTVETEEGEQLLPVAWCCGYDGQLVVPKCPYCGARHRHMESEPAVRFSNCTGNQRRYVMRYLSEAVDNPEGPRSYRLSKKANVRQQVFGQFTASLAAPGTRSSSQVLLAGAALAEERCNPWTSAHLEAATAELLGRHRIRFHYRGLNDDDYAGHAKRIVRTDFPTLDREGFFTEVEPEVLPI